MKVNDAVWGALLLLLAAMILIHVQSFPQMSGQRVGPALFPGLVAIGIGACALLLIVNGLRTREPGRPIAWLRLEAWTRSRHHLLALTLVIGMNVFYVLAVGALGFVLTGIVYLAVLFAVFGVRPRSILPLAIIVTLVIHFAFYRLLKVPLPWGVLQRFAW